MSIGSPPSAGSLRPDPETARLVLASCRALADRETQLADRFAVHLCATGTPVAGAQAADLLHAVLAGVSSTADPAVIETRWQELGARPALAGYADEGFSRVGHALVRAVRDISRDDWSATLSSGWLAFHLWMAQHLALGAARAMSDGGPRREPGATTDRDRVTTEWTYEDLWSTRYGAPPR